MLEVPTELDRKQKRLTKYNRSLGVTALYHLHDNRNENLHNKFQIIEDRLEEKEAHLLLTKRVPVVFQ